MNIGHRTLYHPAPAKSHHYGMREFCKTLASNMMNDMFLKILMNKGCIPAGMQIVGGERISTGRCIPSGMQGAGLYRFSAGRRIPAGMQYGVRRFFAERLRNINKMNIVYNT
jgi:hypothetical protein